MAAKAKLGRGFRYLKDYQNSFFDYSALDFPTPKISHSPRKLAIKIGIASGKGGTGKSVLACNLSLCIAGLGKRVALLDADFGLANDHIILGMYPEYNISHLLEGRKSINDILVETHSGLKFIPGSSGAEWIADLSDIDLFRMMENLGDIEQSSDILFIDTSAGISKSTLLLLLACDEVIIITTKDATAMMDAYALSKIIFRLRSSARIWLVVNRVRLKKEAFSVFKKMNEVAQKFLGKSFLSLGYLKESELVKDSVNDKTPFSIHYPFSLASSAVQTMGDKIMSNGFFSDANNNKDYLYRRIKKIIIEGLIKK